MSAAAKIEKVGLSITEAYEIAGCGRSKLYQYMSEGKLRARKMGRRRIILHPDLMQLLHDLPVVAA